MRKRAVRVSEFWTFVQTEDPWFGASIQGTRQGKPFFRVREWSGWPADLDVPLPLRNR